MSYWTQLLDAILAALPAVGFAMIFNVPRSALKFCALGSTIAYGLREVLIYERGMSIELSTFIASTCIGVIAVFWSRRYIMPRPIYTVPAIIPMIPGTYAYEMMISLVSMNEHGINKELLNSFISNGLHTISILFAITFGLAIPSLYYFQRRRPII